MKVIVTGGASGIGREISSYLTSESFDVVSVDVQPAPNVLELNVSDEESKLLLEGRGFRSGVEYPVAHHIEYVKIDRLITV